MKGNNFQPQLIRALVVIACACISVDSLAAAKYRVLHYFENQPASSPESAMVFDSAGNLYGTTDFSEPDGCGDAGCGTLFMFNPTSGKSRLYRFKSPNGNRPTGGLTFDSMGNLYGTTYLGGRNGLGNVYQMTPSGEKVIYNFSGTGDAFSPTSPLVFDANGNMYGITGFGGSFFHGAVFELQPTQSGWKESVIYSFTGGVDGDGGTGSLAIDSDGNIYGTTGAGGANDEGVVFKLTPSQQGTWTETVLYNFTGGSDGLAPFGGVILNATGTLYGTTQAGGLKSCNGDTGCGTVFELAPSGGSWQFSVLHTFNMSDGAFPGVPLTMDATGNLYGAAIGGGDNNDGAVFKLSQSGGIWTETVLHSFNGHDGMLPYGGLVLDSQGVIYGSAAYGGHGPNLGYGVLFSITQ